MADKPLDKPPQGEPYEPPRVISEEVFESLTVTCGKIDPTQGPSCDPLEGGSTQFS